MARRPRTNQLPGSVSSIRSVTVMARSPVGPRRQPARAVAVNGWARLHVGCGGRRLSGWINADAAPGVGDVILDLHDPAGLQPNSYREIYGCHVLEHCWPRDTPGILKRMHDALVPGGTLRLSVPDLRLVVQNCVDGNAYGDERSALSVLYGGTFSKDTTAPDLHRQAFWRERLERLLREAGFVNIREWGRGQYQEIDALRDYATFPFDQSTGKSLISLNMEADRAGKLVVPGHSVSGAPIDVSVILGTVNRPQMLRDCVEAIRSSLGGSGRTYEIVVAYGAEDDESLPWLNEQQDVVPVLGGMDGAIEAFNRAYAVSRGRLICQINDDVLVDGDSLSRAAQFLDSDPSSSGVVFKFDRGDGQGYRHERLAGTLHPNQMVVRRETCEAVIERIGAFWGDAAHRTDKTYGGDSAFGVVCRHLGLRLDSVEGVTCRDLLAPDTLRARNAAAVADDHGARWRAMYGPLMESFASSPAGDEWPNCYVPRRGTRPRRSPIAAGRPLRVLAMPIAISDWPQTALRKALEKIGPYAEVTHAGQPNRRALEVARQHKPDLVWVQVQRDGWQEFARSMRSAAGPDCTMVQWTGDVRTDAGAAMEPWIGQLAESFDLLLADNTTYPRKLAASGIRAGYLCHGFESELEWEPNAAEDRGGAVFVGTNYASLDGGERQRLFSAVESELPGVLALYGSGWKSGSRSVEVSEAGRIMCRTPVTISTSLFTNLGRYTSNRLKYALAVGAVTAVRRFDDMEGLGLRHGENCLIWSSDAELVSLLKDWTRPNRARDRLEIRRRARALAVDRFTWDTGIEELLAIVRDYRARWS